MHKIIIILIALILTASPAVATTYYIDYNATDDSDNGTAKTSPWKHAPGMIGCSDSCATYESSHSSKTNTDGAGNSFIFKGGVTWPNSVFSWLWNFGIGTEGSPITWGVDATWYTGAVWSRPTMDAEDTVLNNHSQYSSGVGNASMFWLSATTVALSYYVIDNIEWTGQVDPNDDNQLQTVYFNNVKGFELKNCYFHGWSHTSGTKDDLVITYSDYLTPRSDMTSSLHHNVWDGSDTTADMAKVYKGSAGHFYNNYAKGLYNGTISHVLYIWGNTMIDIGETFDPAGHANVFENTANNGAQIIVYNNYIVRADGGATIYQTVEEGRIDYNFNNVIVDDYNQAVQVGADTLITGVGSGAYVFNNTIQLNSSVDFNPINGPSKATEIELPFMTVRNNHLIANFPTVSFGSTVEEGGETESNTSGMTNDNATTLGYVSSGTCKYYPPFGGATIGGGMDLRTLASNIPSLSPSLASTAALSDTTYGVEYDNETNTIVGDGRTAVVRGATWDIGAYEYVSPDNDTATSAPTIVSPDNGTTDVAVTTSITWADGNTGADTGDADFYDVWFDTGNATTKVVDNDTSSTVTYTPPNVLNNDETYYCKFLARNDNDTSTSGVFNFTTIAASSLLPISNINGGGNLVPSNINSGGLTVSNVQ